MRLKTAVLTALTSLGATSMAAHAGTWTPDVTNPSNWVIFASALNFHQRVISDESTYGNANAAFRYSWAPAFIGEDSALSEAEQTFGFNSRRARADIVPGDTGSVSAISYIRNRLHSFYSNQAPVYYDAETYVTAVGTTTHVDTTDNSVDKVHHLKIDPFGEYDISFTVEQAVENDANGQGDNPVHAQTNVLTGTTSEVKLSPK